MRRVLPVLVCLLVASLATATVIVPADFQQVVAGSQIIAHARIVDVRADWADRRRRIDSVVTAAVITPIKGPSQPTLQFKAPGGKLGRYRSVMVGAPVFAAGDEAVLFLRIADGEPLPQVFGLNQGLFRIQADARTGQRLVVPPPLLSAPPGATRLTRGAADRRPLAIDAFGARVRDAMTRPAAPAREAR